MLNFCFSTVYLNTGLGKLCLLHRWVFIMQIQIQLQKLSMLIYIYIKDMQTDNMPVYSEEKPTYANKVV